QETLAPYPCSGKEPLEFARAEGADRIDEHLRVAPVVCSSQPTDVESHQHKDARRSRKPVEERKEKVRIDRKPEVRRLDVAALSDAANLAGHRRLIIHVFDHRVADHHVERTVAKLRELARISLHGCAST